jgi:hypothetical protein
MKLSVNRAISAALGAAVIFGLHANVPECVHLRAQRPPALFEWSPFRVDQMRLLAGMAISRMSVPAAAPATQMNNVRLSR